MKCFKLHDGESDEETNRMHDFLNAPIHSQGHDWDGGNHGLNLDIIIYVGDIMLVRPDQSIRVLRKGEDVLITRDTFPMVHMAMLMIEMDNGAHHLNRIAAVEGLGLEKVDLETFRMPYDYGVDKLCAAERAIWALMGKGLADEISTIVTGEQSEQDALIAKLRTEYPDLPVAHRLLNDWFNFWEDGDKVQYFFKDEKGEK